METHKNCNVNSPLRGGIRILYSLYARALRGQLSRFTSANDEGGIANPLSLISNTIVTSGVACLEPVVNELASLQVIFSDHIVHYFL